MTDKTYTKSPYKVPKNYFSSLEKRLDAIPSGESIAPSRRSVIWDIAAATGIAAALFGGFALLRPTSVQGDADGLSTLEIIRMADLVPVTEPYLIYGAEENEEEKDDLSETDITEYLINSRTTLEYIAYYETVK